MRGLLVLRWHLLVPSDIVWGLPLLNHLVSFQLVSLLYLPFELLALLALPLCLGILLVAFILWNTPTSIILWIASTSIILTLNIISATLIASLITALVLHIAPRANILIAHVPPARMRIGAGHIKGLFVFDLFSDLLHQLVGLLPFSLLITHYVVVSASNYTAGRPLPILSKFIQYAPAWFLTLNGRALRVLPSDPRFPGRRQILLPGIEVSILIKWVHVPRAGRI